MPHLEYCTICLVASLPQYSVGVSEDRDVKNLNCTVSSTVSSQLMNCESVNCYDPTAELQELNQDQGLSG